MHSDLRELELTLEAKLKEMENRITVRLGGMIVAGVAVLAALNQL